VITNAHHSATLRELTIYNSHPKGPEIGCEKEVQGSIIFKLMTQLPIVGGKWVEEWVLGSPAVKVMNALQDTWTFKRVRSAEGRKPPDRLSKQEKGT
jgi:hypothetical protein